MLTTRGSSDAASLRHPGRFQGLSGAEAQECFEHGRRFRASQAIFGFRFLARLVAACGDNVVLKGGLALELRLGRARTTKDIDLRMLGAPSDIQRKLQHAGQLELGDFMTFEVRPDRAHPEIKNPGMRYGGLRFRAECRLAGKNYGAPFGIDVALGEPLFGAPEPLVSSDDLAFAGVAALRIRAYPVALHIAEKLHGYTMVRPRPNTRVRDLPDLALLASAGELASEALRDAIDRTFSHRNTHPMPLALPPPPAAWAPEYAELASEDGLEWPTLDAVYEAACALLNPVLAGTGGQWNPGGWHWR